MSLSHPKTIVDIVTTGDPKARVIGAPGRRDMTRAELQHTIGNVCGTLRAMGIAQNEVVALVMPNGPEMAALFIAVSASAVAAPLNAAYREDEFDFYLGDLKARAIIVSEGLNSPARDVATKRGITVIELCSLAEGPAGSFSLSFSANEGAIPSASPSDISLVLHTSGTTSRPKIVPLSQANLTVSAQNIATTLSLAPSDRSLVIMPLFHIHGLVGALLSSLAAEASVFCPPGFNALKFFTWLEEAKATWFTAVPTMHQVVLGRAERNRQIIEQAKLRFIRSSSASLPPHVMSQLEQTFGCPVIESYGMTEAAHQMASNPLPPLIRKPGCVGLAAGPEIGILSSTGHVLPAGEQGEIAIRGENVTAGYANNSKANAEAFTNGWFRTGDQGFIDQDGYLTLTGRIKEIINRGGEKIAPREVDDVLLSHPAVAQAVTFAMPHDRLGEEVGAAIVLHEGHSADEAELRAFVAKQIVDFKVPRKVIFIPEIPKGPTGKIQRIGMAQRLGLGR
jgi:oxalate---CoA ligase